MTDARCSADIVDALAKTIWLAEFKRAFDRDPVDPWENQAESSKAGHINTARKIIEAGFAQPTPSSPMAFIQKEADEVVSRIVEWDDRTSPDDFPEALLITPTELHRELMRFAEDIGALAAQPPVAPETHSCLCGAGEVPCPSPDGKPLCAAPVSRSSAESTNLRTFDTTGTMFRRLGKVLTITCDSDDIANRVADQLRTPIDATNHHNALKCPYCNPKGLQFAEPAAPVETDIDALTGTADDQGLFASHSPCSADTAKVQWPEPKVTNPDIASPTTVPYINCLIHRVLDAQQDINHAANEGMSQSLCDAAALLDEVEQALRTAALLRAEPQGVRK